MIGLGGRVARWRLALDARRFGGHRADYFDYLHAVLRGMQGHMTIRELFARDARRHGAGTVRGRLSAAWALACEAGGGDLYATWLGYFPADELVLVRAAQSHGNQRLLECFEALAGHLGLLIRARRLLWATLGAAMAAAWIVSLVLAALPWWTVPALERAFEDLPTAYYGDWSRALFACADWLRAWGLLLPAGCLGLIGWCLYALPRAHGPWRERLDRVGPWRLYRHAQALRFLALVTILLRPDPGRTAQLRPVIQLFLPGAVPWMAAHLREMIRRIDQGLAGAEAFDTGLLDRDLYWYLEDMTEARGLPSGVRAAQARMAGLWLGRVRLQAQALRWLTLLVGLAVVLSIGFWHYAAIDELRRGWMMFHASQ